MTRLTTLPALGFSLGLSLLALVVVPLSIEAQSENRDTSVDVIPLFTSAGNVQEGFARIINHSNRTGTVRIHGTDDSGRSFGPVTLSVGARATRHFNSLDLESGNVAKGLSGGLGNGEGNWRLRLESDLDIESGAYIRTPDGFLASVHDVVRSDEVGGETVYHVPIFNPGSNRNQVSWLRLVNLSNDTVDVTIEGRDDAGWPAPEGEVRLSLPAYRALRLSAQQLESGGTGFSGRLGDGTGKWQLFVTADGEIEIAGLLQTPTGHLTNLSVSGLGQVQLVEPESANPGGSNFRDCAQCPEMVVVPAGAYRMGSPVDEGERDADEGPVHHVTIGESFAVGRHEVTFEQWDACRVDGGCSHRPDDQGWGRGSRPVVDVNWHDAQEYVRWLADKTGWSYRLLSESEWEYVARAGTTTRYWWGDEIGHNRANCDGCGSPWAARQTAPVGSFSANAFGLHDVHGNAWEWIEDCSSTSYLGAPSDGSAWEAQTCKTRQIRGGSWQTLPKYLRSANRESLVPKLRLFPLQSADEPVIGFRVARAVGALGRYTLPLFPPAGSLQQGFARVINRSSQPGIVRIFGTDDAGHRRGPITLSLDARATRHFNSGDLEEGNTAKGLSGGLGNGTGDWRLELITDLDIEPSAYIRTPGGFLTAMHAVARTAAVGGEVEHHLPIFNPASNRNQVSWLRIANLSDTAVDAAIRALDDAGDPASGGEVRVTLPPNGARRISSQHLEFGDSAFAGRLDTGKGKWQLFVTADGPIEVVSLLQSPTGHLSNLSTTPPSSSDDHGDTIAEATDVAVGSKVSGRMDSPDDVDYFRIQAAQTGILVVSTNGEVDTELELVDTDGNPLPIVQTSICPPSGTVNDTSAKAMNTARNTASREVEVHAGDIVIARVMGKGQLGGFWLESKIVVPGETVDYSQPSHDLQASLARTNWLTFIPGSGGGTEIAYGDFDGDGDEDVFVQTYHPDAEGEPSVCFPDPYCFTRAIPVEIWENVDNTFALNTQKFFSRNVPEVVAIRKTLIGDFNGDDKPDLFLATHGPAAPPLPREEPPFLFLSTDNGFVQAQGLDHLDGYNHGAASADIDQDGDLDIFVTDTANVPFFLINDGNGNFEKSTNAVPHAINDQGAG